MSNTDFLKRINYNQDILSLLQQVCKDYKIGEMMLYEIVEVGYEDLNIVVHTDIKRYFVKIFANFRDGENCKRYVDLMVKVVDKGIKHPKLYKSDQGYLHNIDSVYLCVMDYIEGNTFFDLETKPSTKELSFLANQATLICEIKIKTKFIYDSWSIINFLEEYKNTKRYLEKEYVELIEPLVEPFREININSLPKALVHGDIISTNVIKDVEGNLWILDFSVSNNYPRIQELVILSCNLGFYEKDMGRTRENIKIILDEYQKTVELEEKELKSFQTLLKVAHAMHIIGSTKSKVEDNNNSKENNYWLKEGHNGLIQTNNLYP